MTKKPQLPVSYYEILQVSEQAGDAEIRSAYRRLAKRFHPDRNTDERKLAELRIKIINEAYANLKTQEKRAAYRRILNKNKKPSWTGGRPMNDNPAPVQMPKSEGFFAHLSRLFRPTKMSS